MGWGGGIEEIMAWVPAGARLPGGRVHRLTENELLDVRERAFLRGLVVASVLWGLVVLTVKLGDWLDVVLS